MSDRCLNCGRPAVAERPWRTPTQECRKCRDARRAAQRETGIKLTPANWRACMAVRRAEQEATA